MELVYLFGMFVFTLMAICYFITAVNSYDSMVEFLAIFTTGSIKTQTFAAGALIAFPVAIALLAGSWIDHYNHRPIVTVEYEREVIKNRVRDHSVETIAANGNLITTSTVELETTYKCVVEIDQSYPGMIFSGDSFKLKFDRNCDDLTKSNDREIQELVQTLKMEDENYVIRN